MDLSKPATTLIRRLDAAALGALYRSERSLTVREIHRLGGSGSYEGIRLALLRLARTGLLVAEERTAGTFYELNRDHLAYPAIESLFTMRPRLIEQIAKAVQAWKPAALHVSLFGSFARQDGDEKSDIDVLVIFDDGDYVKDELWARSVADIEKSLRECTGNTATVITMSRREVRTMAGGKRASQLWKSLRADNIVVYGSPLSELAR